jgi:hypothetical protein
MEVGSMERYVVELLEAYRGEVAGEAYFSALAQETSEPDRAHKWRTLAQLERLVANRIRAALEERGIPIPATEADWQRGLRSATEYIAMPWRDALVRLQPELDRYVRDFEVSESRMPEDLLPLAQFVTAHERALLEFVAMELDHQGTDSLAAPLRLLEESAREPIKRRSIQK